MAEQARGRRGKREEGKQKRAKGLEAWVKTEGKAHDHKKPERHKHPKGMTPGVRLDTKTGEGEAVIAVPAGQDPAWDTYLAEMGFKDVIDVLDVIEVRAWNCYSATDGVQTLRYIKARVKRRMTANERADIDALCREISKRKPGKKAPPTGDKTLFVGLADWQLGKRDGDGTRGIVARVERAIDGVLARASELRKAGHQIGELFVGGMGDMVENCDGHYPMQTFSVELHQRDQRKVGRRLLLAALQAWAPHFKHIHVACVPGNHGENRRDGKAFTSFGDNDDVAVFEQVADAFRCNEEVYGHVSFQVPDEELTVTRDCRGVIVGLAHGHQTGKSGRGDPPSKVKDWWDSCAAVRRPIGDADILVSGHYHHLRIRDCGAGRTWFQCPTLDGGSQWFQEKGGEGSVQGTLTFLIDPGRRRKWSNMEIL